MLKNSEVSNFIKNKFYNNKVFMFASLIIGVLLLTFPKIITKHNINNSEKINNQEFINKIQSDLSKLISNIDGAGKTKVLITINEGEETIYAMENKHNSQTITDELSPSNQPLKKKIDDKEKKYITTKDSNGNETPLVVKKLEPKIRGAVISCQGAKNKEVKENIIKLVSVALDIDPNKICVTKFRN